MKICRQFILPLLSRRVALLSLCLLASPALLYAQQQDPRNLHVIYQIPGTEKVQIKRDLPYKTVGSTALKLDAYYPANLKSKDRLPVVIFINGVGDPPNLAKVKEWGQYTDWGKLIAASGFAAITYEARSAESAADSEALLAYIRGNAEKLNIDENRICVWACSANGRVGLPLINQEGRNYIRAAVFYYAVANEFTTLQDVPLFIARAGLDNPGLNQGIDNLVRGASNQNLSVVFYNYADGRHGFDLFDNTDESREIIQQTLNFIRINLSRPANPVAKRPLSPGKLFTVAMNQGWAQAGPLLEEARKSDPQAAVLRENVLNTLGYQLLQARKVKEAIELFKFVVETYPNSANAYDSLADAYEADGNRELAIQNAEKALRQLGNDSSINEDFRSRIRQSATEKLQRLNAPRSEKL